MSYLDLAKRIRAAGAVTEPTADARLTLLDCVRALDKMYAEIRAGYEPGALPWALDTCPDLAQRFHDTEDAIDRLAGDGPTEATWREALDAHAAVWRELIARYRAHTERRREERE